MPRADNPLILNYSYERNQEGPIPLRGVKGHTTTLATHLERLSERQVGKEDVLLQHVADLAFPPLAESFLVEADAACLQPHTPREAVQQRRLPAAWKPQHTLEPQNNVLLPSPPTAINKVNEDIQKG
jgi:hypothetical protein